MNLKQFLRSKALFLESQDIKYMYKAGHQNEIKGN